MPAKFAKFYGTTFSQSPLDDCFYFYTLSLQYSKKTGKMINNLKCLSTKNFPLTITKNGQSCSTRLKMYWENSVFLQLQTCGKKKRLWHRCFPVNFVKFLRTPFLTAHIRWLKLYELINREHKIIFAKNSIAKSFTVAVISRRRVYTWVWCDTESIVLALIDCKNDVIWKEVSFNVQ